MSKIAGIYWDDTAAAPGISLSVYFSGCHFHCPGCHNPEAQDFSYGEECDLEKIIEIGNKLNKNGVMRRLSILGGEPLCDENLAVVLALINHCKNINPQLKIYIWTGYLFEQLIERATITPIITEILKQTTCVIDGLYEADKRDITLPMRGSTNQRIIYLKDGKPIE